MNQPQTSEKNTLDDSVDWEAVKLAEEIIEDAENPNKRLQEWFIKRIRTNKETAKLTLIFYKVLKSLPKDSIGYTADAYSRYLKTSPQQVRKLVKNYFHPLGLVKLTDVKQTKRVFTCIKPTNSLSEQHLSWNNLTNIAKEKYKSLNSSPTK